MYMHMEIVNNSRMCGTTACIDRVRNSQRKFGLLLVVTSTILVRVIFLIVTLLNNFKVAFHFRVSKSEKNLQNKQE